jgi:hypothetical protein
MDAEDFRTSLGEDQPPDNIAPLLQAMWWNAKGDWQRAHTIAQDVHTAEGSWVHGYLHRQEGDLANAGYWYRQADRPEVEGSLEAEWQTIVEALL